jgi:hypothetical protein
MRAPVLAGSEGGPAARRSGSPAMVWRGPTVHHPSVEATYPGSGEGDPLAVPGVDREGRDRSEDAVTLDVDGELFDLLPDLQGGTHYTWLTGPRHGYGFSLSPTTDESIAKHREHIRGFLAEIDPSTGYLGK